jgi:hypothetical protein
MPGEKCFLIRMGYRQQRFFRHELESSFFEPVGNRRVTDPEQFHVGHQIKFLVGVPVPGEVR